MHSEAKEKRTPKRPLFQFSLRGLMLMVLACGLTISAWQWWSTQNIRFLKQAISASRLPENEKTVYLGLVNQKIAHQTGLVANLGLNLTVERGENLYFWGPTKNLNWETSYETSLGGRNYLLVFSPGKRFSNHPNRHSVVLLDEQRRLLTWCEVESPFSYQRLMLDQQDQVALVFVFHSKDGRTGVYRYAIGDREIAKIAEVQWSENLQIASQADDD